MKIRIYRLRKRIVLGKTILHVIVIGDKLAAKLIDILDFCAGDERT